MEQEARESNDVNTNIDELTRLATDRARDKAHDVVKLVASIGAILISIGLAYGNLTAKTSEFENRLKAVEASSKERDDHIQRDLADIKSQLSDIEGFLRNGSNRPNNSAGGGK